MIIVSINTFCRSLDLLFICMLCIVFQFIFTHKGFDRWERYQKKKKFWDTSFDQVSRTSSDSVMLYD